MDEVTPDVPIDQITPTVNPAYRYGVSLTDDQWSVGHGFGDDLEACFRTDTCEELTSYTIGCMMGRYSLDRAGLVHEHVGNEGSDPGRYPSFPADDDGIIPVTDFAWFDDDAKPRSRLTDRKTVEEVSLTELSFDVHGQVVREILV